MNSLLILPDECVDLERAVLRGVRAHYAYHTHELRAGITICGGILERGMGELYVEAASPEEVALHITLTRPALSPQPIDVVVGISRPQTVKKVIQATAMLGARSLAFVGSECGEKSYLQSHVLKPEAIQEEMLKALEQIADCYAPTISVHRELWRYVRDGSEIFARKRLLVAHPGGVPLTDEFLGRATTAAQGAHSEDELDGGVVLAIGPEKGWSEGEVALFLRNGFHAVGLGERVLRVELALVAFFAQVDQLRRLKGISAKA
jgi:16S rRNA (uracil1498-N3)-methyltransferase